VGNFEEYIDDSYANKKKIFAFKLKKKYLLLN
jgi:hypothetical protein